MRRNTTTRRSVHADSVSLNRADGRFFRCCRTRVDALRFDDAVDELCRRADRGRAVHLCTTHTLSLAARDPEFAELLNRAHLNLPDGMPLVWIARRLGIDIDRQVGGRDLMASTLDKGRQLGLRHYLYGSTPDVMEALVRSIEQHWPGAEIVGTESPPFRPLSPGEDRALADRIRRSDADVVWVGLGTPKQDSFVDAFSTRVDAALVAVGAAFDFHAGTKATAPTWMTQHGLEWLFRLLKEPRRLWRRYLFGHSVFLGHTLLHPPRLCDEECGHVVADDTMSRPTIEASQRSKNEREVDACQ